MYEKKFFEKIHQQQIAVNSGKKSSRDSEREREGEKEGGRKTFNYFKMYNFEFNSNDSVQ